ncbi:hypothetical protein TWF173_003009 [Orbilia oligospora]|nr:hypothetical protein TWF173_003009 [Orbilia oligospora]
MDRKHETWAVLIAVECYFQGNERPIEYHKLHGCVRDVRAVEEYLQQQGVQNIKTLTASGDKTPVESDTDLPIYKNIKREFEHITKNAGAGDIVYIHYSGHGIRRGTLGHEQKNDGDNITGTALALADVMIGGAYLTGYQLGVFVKKMVREKDLRVTLVLDSCFSGQGFRNARKYTFRTMVGLSDVSTLESDKKADEIANSTDPSPGLSTDINPGPGSRRAQVKRSWLSNPSGCTVLTACQFDEAAGENNFPGTDGAHGVLTYWMLKALRDNSTGRRLTHANIKEYVNSNIMRMNPKLRQSPVLHGDGDYVFLGNELVVERPACHVLRRYESFIDLGIGRAQGVSIGAIYDVYPEPQKGGAVDASRPLRAQVIEVCEKDIFLSKAEFFQEDTIPESENSPHLAIGRGSRAVLRTWGMPSDIWVNISIPTKFKDAPKLDLEKLDEELGRRAEGIYLRIESTNNTTGESSFTITLILNDFKEFEIEIMGKRITRIPRVPLEDGKWIQKTAYLLCHLARFYALHALPNDLNRIKTPFPANWFSYTAEAKGLETIQKVDEKYHVKGGEELKISLKLNDICPLEFVYVTFYGFNSVWGIHKVHPGPGQAAIKVPRKRPERFAIAIDVAPPNSEGNSVDIEDTIRALISTREVSWEELTLPDLPVEELSVLEGLVNGITVAEEKKDVANSIETRMGEGALERNFKCIPLEDDRVMGVLDLVFRTTQENVAQ